MTTCPHCYTDSATVRWQAERIEVLEEEVRQLKETPPAEMPMDGLSQSEANMLTLLLTREIVQKYALFNAINHNRGASGDNFDMVNVMVCRLRKKIRPLGLHIFCRYNIGYYIPREQKAALAALTNNQPLPVNQNEWEREPPAKTAAER